MTAAAHRFAHRSGWEPDYVAPAPGGLLVAGYLGPFSRSADAGSTVSDTLGPLLRARLAHLGPRDSLTAVTVADRLLVAWAPHGPVGLVTARFVRTDGLSCWYLTTGAVEVRATGRRLYERLVRRLLAEEPADVLAGTTRSDAVHRAFRRIAPRGRVHPDGRGRPTEPVRAVAADIVGGLLGADAVAQMDVNMVRRGCYMPVGTEAAPTGDLVRRLGLGSPDGVVLVADLSGRLAPRSAANRPTPIAVRARPRILAVTGTNGKTSVVEAGRQIAQGAGRRAASHGTLGVITERGRAAAPRVGGGAAGLPTLARRLWECGVDVLWTEAFSYALGEGLLDDLPVDVALFTQAGTDHLGAHGSLAAYLAAKDRLFDRVVASDGVAVVDPRAPGADRVLSIAARRGLPVITTGPGQRVELTADTLRVGSRRHRSPVPFTSPVLARNLELAVAGALALGIDETTVAEACRSVTAPPGRFEVLETGASFRIVVDAAHNADALEHSLGEIRRDTPGRVLVLVASVGTADRHRWEALGEVADVLADVVVVTDESPHGCDPGEIRGRDPPRVPACGRDPRSTGRRRLDRGAGPRRRHGRRRGPSRRGLRRRWRRTGPLSHRRRAAPRRGRGPTIADRGSDDRRDQVGEAAALPARRRGEELTGREARKGVGVQQHRTTATRHAEVEAGVVAEAERVEQRPSGVCQPETMGRLRRDRGRRPVVHGRPALGPPVPDPDGRQGPQCADSVVDHADRVLGPVDVLLNDRPGLRPLDEQIFAPRHHPDPSVRGAGPRLHHEGSRRGDGLVEGERPR